MRKIQIPGNTEAGFGAVIWDGQLLIKERLHAVLKLSQDEVDAAISMTRKNVHEWIAQFTGERPFLGLAGKTTNPIDDGLASGFTMLTAIKSIRINHPVRIIIAAPTASASSAELTGGEVDHLFCLNISSHQWFAVAEAYVNWYDREIGKYSQNL